MHFIDEYISYFKHQAVNHPSLLHLDESGQKVFEVISPEEVAIGHFRTAVKEKSYILRLILYTYELGDNETENALKEIMAGFVVAKHHSLRTSGSSSFYNALSGSEKVGDEIIEKMIADSRNGHPLFNNSFNTAHDIIVSPAIGVGDTGYSGWMYTFRFSNFWRNCLTAPGAPVWVDEGLTPY